MITINRNSKYIIFLLTLGITINGSSPI